MLKVPKKPGEVTQRHLEFLENAFSAELVWPEGFNPFEVIGDAMKLREALCFRAQYRIDIESDHAAGSGDVVSLDREMAGNWKNVVFKLNKKGEIAGRVSEKKESGVMPVQLEGHSTAFLITCAVLYSMIDQEFADEN